MSNHLAVATVTRTLTHVLNTVVSAGVLGATATALRPDGPPAGAGQAPRVNVFLYQLTPNGAFRGSDLPTRDGGGGFTQRPVAAVDLHYLLTFYGSEPALEPQRVLGTVARFLHAQPTLRRDDITAAIAASPPLAGSDLASQQERVRITPVSLSLEDLSKLWSVFFQVPYAVSAAYMASVVLLEADATPGEALPVRHVRPVVSPAAAPRIDNIEPTHATLTPGLRVKITGEHLVGPSTRYLFGGQPGTLVVAESTAAHAVVELPVGVRPGLVPLTVVDEGSLGPGHVASQSNVVVLALPPAVPTISFVPGAGTAHFKVTVAPAIAADQVAELLLTAPAGGGSFVLARRPPATAGTLLVFPTAPLPPGAYPYRLRVDGADTPLTFDTASADPLHQPVNGPMVTVV